MAYLAITIDKLVSIGVTGQVQLNNLLFLSSTCPINQPQNVDENET